jgi:hypothetical protein
MDADPNERDLVGELAFADRLNSDSDRDFARRIAFACAALIHSRIDHLSKLGGAFRQADDSAVLQSFSTTRSIPHHGAHTASVVSRTANADAFQRQQPSCPARTAQTCPVPEQSRSATARR